MKTWTFGSGLTALRHMAMYTDKDGLYMETQSGRFIWDGNYEFIDPGQTDGWTEYWFGAGQLGGLTTATQRRCGSPRFAGAISGDRTLRRDRDRGFPAGQNRTVRG